MLNRSRPILNHVLTLTMASSALIVVTIAIAQQVQPPAAPTTPAQSAPAPVPLAPASTADQEKLRIVPAKHLPGKVHLLPATIETATWGWFNNAQPPVLHVASGALLRPRNRIRARLCGTAAQCFWLSASTDARCLTFGLSAIRTHPETTAHTGLLGNGGIRCPAAWLRPTSAVARSPRPSVRTNGIMAAAPPAP